MRYEARKKITFCFRDALAPDYDQLQLKFDTKLNIKTLFLSYDLNSVSEKIYL